MQRNSEYGKLLRNKQVLKRSYLLSEKQFAKIVKVTASQYAKNQNAQVVVISAQIESELVELEKATGMDVRNFDDALSFRIAMMVLGYINYVKNNK